MQRIQAASSHLHLQRNTGPALLAACGNAGNIQIVCALFAVANLADSAMSVPRRQTDNTGTIDLTGVNDPASVALTGVRDRAWPPVCRVHKPNRQTRLLRAVM